MKGRIYERAKTADRTSPNRLHSLLFNSFLVQRTNWSRERIQAKAIHVNESPAGD